jgi:hypothetical protein
MLDLIKNHWLCFLLGGAVGYCLHFCPILCSSAGVCPVDGLCNPACACDNCVCDVCKCDDTGCKCPN